MSDAAAAAAASAVSGSSSKKSKDDPANTEPLTLDEERQLRVNTTLRHTHRKCKGHAHTGVLMTVAPNSIGRFAVCLSFHPSQLHYVLQLNQMAQILRLPTHVTVRDEAR